MSTPLQHAVARKARSGRPGTPAAEVEAASQDLATEKIASAVQKALASAPPLSAEQLDRLGALLRGGAQR